MSLQAVYQSLVKEHGPAQAMRWLREQAKTRPSPQADASPHPPLSRAERAQEPLLPHKSHIEAEALLAADREALGPAYETVLLIARWSIEHATPESPAPHLMTTYWSLEEATGKSERTLRRHLVEPNHAWSKTVKQYIDIRHNYGKMLCGRDDSGQPVTRTVICSTVIRFFTKKRLSNKARVKLWGQRDLLADSDNGMTRPSREATGPAKERYNRQNPGMSEYSSLREQVTVNKWIFTKLEPTVTNNVENNKDCGKLYSDIPTNHVLNALYTDLGLMLENAKQRGASVKRARSLWVDMAAQLLARRHGEHVALPSHVSTKHVTHWDGFTNFWRRLLWTAVRAELYGGTKLGWSLLQRLVVLAREAVEAGKRKPVAWAWSIIKLEGFKELLRDFNTGTVGEVVEAVGVMT